MCHSYTTCYYPAQNNLQVMEKKDNAGSICVDTWVWAYIRSVTGK